MADLTYNLNVRLMKDVGYVVIAGSERQLEVERDAIGLPDMPDDAVVAVLQVQRGKIRYTLDGSEPTTQEGFIIDKDTNPPYMVLEHRVNLEAFRMVRDAGQPVVRVAYGRLPEDRDITLS